MPTDFLPTDKPGVVTVESRRNPGTFYTVTGFGTPFAVCNCPGYVNRGHCWHVDAASEEGATVMWQLPDTTIAALEEPLDPKRVVTFTQGPQQGTPFLEHHDVVRTANRIFGYGQWGFRTVGLPVMIEAGEQGQKNTPYEVWAVQGELTVHGCPPFNDVGTNVRQGKGSAGLEMAFKGAASDALKRCLRHYGDQFGLVLYDKEIGRQDLAERFEQAHGAPSESLTDDPVPDASLAQRLEGAAAPNEWTNEELNALLKGSALVMNDLVPIVGEGLTRQNFRLVISRHLREKNKTLAGLVGEAAAYHAATHKEAVTA